MKFHINGTLNTVNMKKVDLVTTKTPLRVSFLGGGTDIKNFYGKFGGSVLSSAIDKYVYVTVKRHSPCFKEKFRLNYSKSETGNSLSKIQNNIVRECIKLVKINFPIYISTVGDVPTGSGLGGSSSFTVGLLNALYAIQGKKIKKKRLFEDACRIEIEILKEPIGKQDQVPAVYGGLNFISFKKNSFVKIDNIKEKKIYNNLFKNSLLIWTRDTRSASEVLKRLPNLPIIMDRANDVMTLITEGKFNPNTMAYQSLKNEELKLEIMRNKILGVVLVLVIFAFIVFK